MWPERQREGFKSEKLKDSGGICADMKDLKLGSPSGEP